MGRYKTAVITTLDDVPAGYVQLNRLSARGDGTQDRTLHKALSEAHMAGVLPAVKLFRSASDWKTGPVFLDRDASEKFIAEWRSVREPKPVVVVADEPTPAPMTDAMEELRLAIVSLAADVRNLQAAVELRAEITA